MATVDYSALDDLGISMNAFYPRKNWSATPQGAIDHAVAVNDEISLSCRFFPVGQASPTILFFYGNGETATDYNGIAPLYNQTGLNFFVSDYRGYGNSGGWPSFTTMLSDSHSVLEYAAGMLASDGYTGRMYVMGALHGPALRLRVGSQLRRPVERRHHRERSPHPGQLLLRTASAASTGAGSPPTWTRSVPSQSRPL